MNFMCRARRVFLGIQVVAPETVRDDTICVRVESLIRFDVIIHPDPPNAPFLWEFIKIPKTGSVRDTAILARQRYLSFSLELRGATSNDVCRIVCQQCGRRKSQRGAEIVDFDSPTDLVEIVDGRARICFRLKCYAQHNRSVDDEYMYVAVRSPARHQSNLI